jgi:hypothetical protein
MREDEGEPGWNVVWQLPLAYAIGGVVLGWPLMLTVWPYEFPDHRPYLVTAAAVCLVLTIAVFAGTRRLALAAAIVIPLVVSAGWHLLEVRWNSDLHGMAASGDAASIAAILRGRQGGWLWAIGPATVTGSAAALAYALFCMWKRERLDRG